MVDKLTFQDTYKKYLDIELEVEKGKLIKEEIIKNSYKNKEINGEIIYGKLIHNHYFRTSDLIYDIEYFVSYDQNYRFIYIKNEETGATYQKEKFNGIEFLIGDKVRLKSGGTIMKVKDIDNNYVDCHWIDQLGTSINSSFPVFSLELVLE